MLTLLEITFRDLLNPQFYIENGGLWVVLFIVFAETGLFAGFFLPGDSLLFVSGIFSNPLITEGLKIDLGSEFLNLLLLITLIALAGIIGNEVGYWFGKKSGPTLFKRKDSFFFKRKYLMQAHDFFEKKGGSTIIISRFLPIIRTFTPIVAGIVGMSQKKFRLYSIIGSFTWAASMCIAGHYLNKILMSQFGFDLQKHLEIVVLGIVLVTTVPVIMKMFFGKKKSQEEIDAFNAKMNKEI